MEYKVHVEAGKEDCYWQYVHPGATLFVSAQVLKGNDFEENYMITSFKKIHQLNSCDSKLPLFWL